MPMGPLNVPVLFGFRRQASNKCPCSYPVQICDTNHSLMRQCSHPTNTCQDCKKKTFNARNGSPTRCEDCFQSPSNLHRRREMAQPGPWAMLSAPFRWKHLPSILEWQLMVNFLCLKLFISSCSEPTNTCELYKWTKTSLSVTILMQLQRECNANWGFFL